MERVRWAAVAVLTVAACGGAGSPPPNTTPAASPTTSTTVPATNVPDVEQFAFVRAIDESEIRFDPARMLTGQEAIDAAEAEGQLPEGETLPNDYYISNPDQEEVVATLTPDGNYLLIGFDRYGGLIDRRLSLDDLVAVLNGANTEAFYGIVPGDVPMTLTLNGDTVVAARQQYLP